MKFIILIITYIISITDNDILGLIEDTQPLHTFDITYPYNIEDSISSFTLLSNANNIMIYNQPIYTAKML